MIQRPLRRFVHVLIWLLALAPPVVSVGYLMYANLLDPREVERLTGGYDGLYWDAAQMQIAWTHFENRLLMYGDGLDHNLDDVRLSYQMLLSKLTVMAGSTRTLSDQPALMQQQEDKLRQLVATVAQLGSQLSALERDPSLARSMALTLRAHRADVTDLALARHFAEVSGREAIRNDFIAKRRELFAAGIVLLLLSAAAAALLVLNGYRRTRLIRQQHALLEAEHQASRAAREASMAKDAFLGMISHELRTPLHAIVSSIELLGFSAYTESDRKVIQRLEAAARQLETQMKDLTDYARLGAGKLELRHEQFDPRELLRSIVDVNEAAALARGLAFGSAAHGAYGLVESDPHRIRQIANNLVSNAIRYTERGSVQIEFRMATDRLTIVVGDTGPGFEVAQIPRIFEAFTQLDALRSRRYEGAGMGLAIVRGLVDLFGGTIETASRPGEGSMFTVTIPVKPVVGPVRAPRERAGRSVGGCPQVLVVDDNEPVRESLCEMLAHMGYTARAAADADTALALLDAHPCDVVLLDLHMPGRDGYAFAAALDARTPRPRVIAVSAYAPELVAQGQPAPFFDCLTKPVHYGVLEAALQQALALARE